MPVDPLSPIAPARIRALLLPVGRIKRSRFLTFVELLQQHSMVRLGDISPDTRADRNMFSPLAFPNGTLLYDLSTSLPPASQLSLSPFEQFREPLLIIGIADATEYPWLAQSRADGESANGLWEEPDSEDSNANELFAAAESLREQFPKAYLHNVMIFESTSQNQHPRLSPETLLIPPIAQLKTTTMKTVMCDLTSILLADMTTLAKSLQALPTVVSPASQAGSIDNTPSWAGADPASILSQRRNSQITIAGRPESPVSGAQKDAYRMSMPVLPSNPGGPLTTDDPRAASPGSQGPRTPPTTFDEISGIDAAQPSQQTSGNSRPNTATKEASDRVSIQGFGSGGVGERARNKGRGRVSVVIGALYMCAGQWHEAVRELTDGATRARALSDHLWHAKALENIMVCLLLFSWSGMDFQIPQVCYSTYDKSLGTKSPDHTPSNSVADVTMPGRSSGHEAALESLNSLLPDLINTILNLYTRAANFAGESLPPLAFSECIIRFSKLLAAMNLSAGFLDEDTLHHLVRNTPYRQKPRLSVPRLSVHPTRHDIATMLFRALPGPVEASGISPTDRVVVLAGVASVLSSLGLQRKKAIVMKEFITSLIPGLVQARKIGAAEMGVHPAAGLAALNMVGGTPSGAGALNLGEGEIENGIDEFLGLLGRIYGIPNSKGPSFDVGGMGSVEPGVDHPSNTEASGRIVDHILKNSTLRSFGSLSVKLEVLRMCLHFCEALPDFNGVLHFTALLLRVAGPGTAPKPNSTDVFVSLLREEQVRLYSNISRTVAAATKLGLQHTETEYWDDFLVRGLFILEEAMPLRLTHHRPAELDVTIAGKDGPFIHNPWMKKPQTVAAETVLVANEHYRFVIALQNPYDFELEVTSLRIAADGVEFEAKEEHFVLGPYRTQKFPISGKALSSGSLKIIGCYVKVIGCRERLFPIFPEPWKPIRNSKMKNTGLKACVGAPTSRPSTAISAPAEKKPAVAPQPETLTFNVIPDQPILVVSGVSLPQSALMVLEGERKKFTVTVKNTSLVTAVDFVHISFTDSATAAVQLAISNKDLPLAELHEMEVQLAHFPSLQWCKEDNADESVNIPPGTEMDFTIEVIGRTRLTDAIIQIDYANLGKRRSEIVDKFFTRHISVPVSITVNASVQLQRPDIVSLSGDFAWASKLSKSENADVSGSQSSISIGKNVDHFKTLLPALDSGSEYCMLLLDLRNSWPNPLSVMLQARRPSNPTEDGYEYESWDNAYTVNEVIQPGHVNRVAIVLPKVYLKNPHAAVPSLNPSNQRQFVVSTSKISPETERVIREAFWYRTELLKFVRGMWREESNGRHGEIELRSIQFSARMVEAIKLDDILIETSIEPDFPDAGAGAADVAVRQLGRTKFQIAVDEFLTLTTKVTNRSAQPISPILRLQPHLANLVHNVALDLDKRLSWTGVLQNKLPVIQPGESVESELGLVALCSGTFEIGATVDEAEILKTESSESEGHRQRSDTQALLQGDILGEPKLRSWHMREPCTLVARGSGDH